MLLSEIWKLIIAQRNTKKVQSSTKKMTKHE